MAIPTGTPLIANGSNMSVPGVLTAGTVLEAANIAGGRGATQTIATTGTIAANGRVAYITGAGTATANIAQGTYDQQQLTIVNLGTAVTVTAATSGLATVQAIAALAKVNLVWDSASALWY